MWQLKTFWHEHRMLGDDLHIQDFESIETKPALCIDKLSPDVYLIVQEMCRHRDNIRQPQNKGELFSFWLRKSHKLVLSVLMLRRTSDAAPLFFRGINVEVSLPTGSLCSERNVIGTALAHDPTIRRKDFSMIAVLSLSMGSESNEGEDNPLSPCGACNEWLKKIAEIQPDFRVVTFTDEFCSNVYVNEVNMT